MDLCLHRGIKGSHQGLLYKPSILSSYITVQYLLLCGFTCSVGNGHHDISYRNISDAGDIRKLCTEMQISAVTSLTSFRSAKKTFERASVKDSLYVGTVVLLLQVIFDLTHELLCAEYQVTANPNTFPWMKENLGSHCSRHLCRTDVNEVKVHPGNVKCTITRVSKESRLLQWQKEKNVKFRKIMVE